jgi:hypothetical protein
MRVSLYSMRFLSRFVMVLVLLGGLAYGSYALGRYVLSTRLFGNTVKPNQETAMDAVARSTRVAGAVTRQVDIKGKPRVEVKVLPADQAGPGPEPPSISDLEKAAQGKSYTPSRPSRTRIVTPQTFRAVPRVRDNSGSRYTSDERAEEERPRRRRRRRTRRRSSDTSYSTNSRRTTRSDSSSSGNDGGVTILGGASSTPEYSSGSSDNAPMPREDGTPSRSYGGGSSEEQPRVRRRRERSSSDDSSSTRSSRPRRSITESPVPRPEGGSSGDSPIPQPE